MCVCVLLGSFAWNGEGAGILALKGVLCMYARAHTHVHTCTHSCLQRAVRICWTRSEKNPLDKPWLENDVRTAPPLAADQPLAPCSPLLAACLLIIPRHAAAPGARSRAAGAPHPGVETCCLSSAQGISKSQGPLYTRTGLRKILATLRR